MAPGCNSESSRDPFERFRSAGYKIMIDGDVVSIDGITVAYDRVVTDPDGVWKDLISARQARSRPDPAEGRKRGPREFPFDHPGLPGREFTSGGDHISDRSG